jgi:hypothetical protein
VETGVVHEEAHDRIPVSRSWQHFCPTMQWFADWVPTAWQ